MLVGGYSGRTSRPFHDPPAAVAAQFTPVLMGRVFVGAPRRDGRLHAPMGQPDA
jgi:hypothetical protein